MTWEQLVDLVGEERLWVECQGYRVHIVGTFVRKGIEDLARKKSKTYEEIWDDFVRECHQFCQNERSIYLN